MTMKQLLLIALLLVSAPAFMGTSCKRVATNSDPCAGVMCTMMFAMITVQVTDADGIPAKLDEAYTVRNGNGAKITVEQHMTDGRYTVLDDSYQKELSNKTDDFRFVGIKNGIRVVDEPYTLGADCCHVRKENGRDTIIVK